MQGDSKDQGMTKQEILKRLQGHFTSRQMTEFCNKGWLPTWRERRTRPGSNAPVYIWDESVVKQASLLYDLLQVSRADHWVRLALWLRGFPVDFAPVRQRWLASMDAYLEAFTQGEADNPLDNITDVVSQLERKWEHTPTRHRPELLRQMGLAAFALGIERFLDVLLVPGDELDETTLAEVFAQLRTPVAAGSDNQSQGEFAEEFSPWLQTLQEILAIPRLREVIEQATSENWGQARQDYVTLCQFFHTLFAPVTQDQPDWVKLLFFVDGGFYLVPVALAIRHWGYGRWIDDAFAWMNEQLADPDVQARLTEQLDRYRRGEMLGNEPI